MNWIRRVARFGMLACAFTTAFWIGWAVARLAFTKTYDLDTLFFVCIPPGIVAASLFLLLRPKREGFTRRFLLVLVCCSCGLFTLMTGLHYARKPPTRFEFLGNRAMNFPTDPGLGGFFGAIYSFRADPEALMSEATSELTAGGYRVQHVKGGLQASQQLGPDEYGVTIDISRGRAKGQHFHIDGDYVDVEKRDDWVTIDIVEPDVAPLWLREWLP